MYGPVYSLALQTDGKILVGGGFTNLYGQNQIGLGRLNPDSTLEQAGFYHEVLASPTVTLQPETRKAYVTDTVTICVTSTGVEPLSYQWRVNGAELASGTNACLTLNNLQPHQVGVYIVVVSNVYGAVTSAPVTLEVMPIRLEALPVQPDGTFAIEAYGPAGAVFELFATANVCMPFTHWTSSAQ